MQLSSSFEVKTTAFCCATTILTSTFSTPNMAPTTTSTVTTTNTITAMLKFFHADGKGVYSLVDKPDAERNVEFNT